MAVDTARILELFPLLAEMSSAEQGRWLARETEEVRARLQRMLSLETQAFTAATHGAMESHAAPPEQVGDFRLLHRIGEGGMGLVFLAEQGTPRRRVAVKLLRQTLFNDEARRQFDAEVELLARLTTRGVPFLIAAGEQDGWPWLAMEWIQGTHLDIWMEAATPSERLSAVVAVGQIVAVSHGLGVAHLDLKPSNILMGPAGPIVLDFGIAGIAGVAGEGSGTPGWRAPEQVAGRTIDIRSDVYSLAKLASKWLAYTPALEIVLARATAGDPEARYPDCGALAEALRASEGNVDDFSTSPAVFFRRAALVGQSAPASDGLWQMLERAEQGDPELQSTVKALARSLDEGVLQEAPEAELRMRLILAQVLHQNEAWQLALRQAEAARSLAPEVDDTALVAGAYLEEAATRRCLGELDEAEEALNRAERRLVTDHPLRLRLSYLRGRLAMNRHDGEAACGHLQAAVDTPVPSHIAGTMLVHALTMAGYAERAERQSLQLIARERERGDSVLRLAAALATAIMVYTQNKKWAQVVPLAQEEVQILESMRSPKRRTALARGRLARALAATGDRKGAVRIIDQAVEDVDADFSSIYVTQVDILTTVGESDRAIAIGEHRLTKDSTPSDQAILHTLLAHLYAERGESGRARTAMTLALPTLRTWVVGGAMAEELQEEFDFARSLGLEDVP
jgi:serine/threonine protein kinase